MINRNNFWPIAIAGVLAVTVVANGFLLYEATAGDGSALEADYYRKAVSWDSTAAQARRNLALGWRLVGALGAEGAITVQIIDPAGTPIDSAAITIDGFAVAHGSGAFSTTLAPTADHRYTAAVRLEHAGLHEVRFTVVRGTDRFTETLRGEPGGPLTPRT